MRKIFVTGVLAFFALASVPAGAATITLVGNNALPGFVDLKIDGIDYQALDYTPQYFSAQGNTWTGNVLTYSQLPTDGYYGPSDPGIEFGDYLNRYREDVWLFVQLLSAPNEQTVGNIQGAAYFIMGGTGVIDGVDLSSPGVQAWVTAARAVNADTVDTTYFRFVDSALTDKNRQQGFIINVAVPEPLNLALMGLGLVGIGLMRRVRSGW